MDTINSEKVDELLSSLETSEKDKKLTIYSRPAATILRYLDLTQAQFSRAGAAAEIMEKEVQKEYKDLWNLFKDKGVLTTVKLERSYWPLDIKEADEKIWAQALEETNTRKGRLITIYHPRMAVVLRYLDLTTPRFSLSDEAGRLLENAMKKKVPGLWGRAESK
jgi:hypothetical protein